MSASHTSKQDGTADGLVGRRFTILSTPVTTLSSRPSGRKQGPTMSSCHRAKVRAGSPAAETARR
jgi:hypothetical protein